MSRAENLGQCEELRIRRKMIEAEITSHCDSIRHAIPLTAEPAEMDGEYIMRLAIKLNERLQEWKGVTRKIDILERDLGV
ncbi:MAG: hypothetical protein J1E80_06600 [Desulfovibrionaceae bacterium]|nr:hypothetical protein [Desulfovibrionaceae bacterium]